MSLQRIFFVSDSPHDNDSPPKTHLEFVDDSAPFHFVSAQERLTASPLTHYNASVGGDLFHV